MPRFDRPAIGSRTIVRVPKYRHQKLRNKAFVCVKGQRIYLGEYDSPESRTRYQEILNELELERNRRVPNRSTYDQPELCISELLVLYLRHAEEYYRDRHAPPGPDGRHPPSASLANIKHAIRRLKDCFGRRPVSEFDSLAFKDLQAKMASEKRADGRPLTRTYINGTMKRIRRVFTWGVAEKLVRPEQLVELRAVPSLKPGRTDAREPDPKESVADEWVDAVLPYLSRHVAAMVKLQRLTGMRSDELCRLRACDIDRAGEIWLYDLNRHKTAHKGKRRVVPLGPQSQLILRAFVTDLGEKFLFSPRDAEAERAEQLRANRKTPVQPSQRSRRKKSRKRGPGERYTTGTYRNAVQRAIARANEDRQKKHQPLIPMWHPYQLRHAHSTTVRKQFGEEAAQVSLGHARMDTTALYGERNLQLAIQVARELG